MLEIKKTNNEKGLTLVELLVSLLLVSLVGITSYQLMTFMQKNYQRNQAYCQLTSYGSIATSRIASDIRSAVKPNNDTHAVNVSPGGQSMDIYTCVSGDPYPCKQIHYQLVNSSGGYADLSRTLTEATTAPSTGIPSYTANPSTTIVLRKVKVTFADNTTGNGDRRLIGLEFKLHDYINATPAITDQVITQTFVTRTQALAY